ncbi:MAG TPA: SGNH/GDSL hydrolase family protein, partial [Solirubrobacterales bacterium]|nr:SGNH/GDSL hydrolase family protein [Solirubrobacterales bacterium]
PAGQAAMMSPVIKRPFHATLLLTALGLMVAGPAGAKPVPVKPPAEVEVERAAVAAGTARPTLLVPVRYPIQLAGHRAETRVTLLGPNGKPLRSQVLRARLNSGRIRRPDRRRSFTFVHRVVLAKGLSRALRTGSVQIVARAKLDLDRDGHAELRSSDHATHAPTWGERKEVLCSSVPHLRVQPGRQVTVPVPVCATRRNWIVLPDRAPGFARVKDGRLIYHASKRFRGRVGLQMNSSELRPRSDALASEEQRVRYVQVTVGPASGAVVRALGDSVTAGFGFYSNGHSMTIGRLLDCRPMTKEFNDACSSNSLDWVSKEEKVDYAPDYGLSNNVSWAAQWANSHGVSNYKNFAISGSEPKDWAPEGEFHSTTEQIASEDPDYILMTMGANPLLSEMLFGVDNMGCAVEADILGGYRECVEAAFAEVKLREYLKSLYSDLVANTQATIFLMQYHLSVPSTALAYSATQIAMMGQLLNREVASVAAEVSPNRLQVVTPPHFNVGIDISPAFPSGYSCSLLGYEVDGPSVQSEPTQDELEVLHPLSFCDGPAAGGPPWVIGGDTGIHPSAAGYAQMASQVPAPS